VRWESWREREKERRDGRGKGREELAESEDGPVAKDR
jgi:hypothetical protein